MRLRVYQFKSHPLLQITNGGTPHTFPEDAGGWVLLNEIEATIDHLAMITQSAANQTLADIEREGYVVLSKPRITEAWLSKHGKK